MKIEYTSAPNNEDINFLAQKIDEEIPYKSASYPFAFFMRDELGTIIAGCSGETMYGVIHTDKLWVNPDCRKQGLGRRLMESVHEYGSKIGCHISTVLTMSFQEAREFYEHLGYECDLDRAGYADNSSCLFLKKTL
jgi:GNAT superfamily N-acetyltransferase